MISDDDYECYDYSRLSAQNFCFVLILSQFSGWMFV